MAFFLGRLFQGLVAVSLVPLFFALWMGEPSFPFWLMTGLTAGGAAAFFLSGTRRADVLTLREGVAVTGLAWILASALGATPYIAGGWLGGLDAFLEAVSGFTGAGATVITCISELPQSILLWRSLTHWVGGLGIIVIFMAILPQGSRGAVYMFRAESTGPTHDRQMPKIRDNAKALFSVYVALTFLCALVYALCGLTPFVAVNHAMTTIATGGYSVYNDTVKEYGNLWLELAMSFFMVISSGSFAMYVLAWRHGARTIFYNTEFRVYLWLIGIAALLISIDLALEMQMDPFSSIRYAVFHVASLSSTTGFVSHDFDTWPPFAKGLLLMTMFLGGCAGSTAGGLKVSRIILLVKMVQSILQQKLHPQMISPVKMNGQIIPDEVLFGVARFFFAYVVMDILFAFVMLADGIDLINAISVSVSTMGSVGPGFGIEGATSTYALLPDMSKAFACIFMFLARLEIFTVLAMLTPEFWSTKKGW